MCQDQIGTLSIHLKPFRILGESLLYSTTSKQPPVLLAVPSQSKVSAFISDQRQEEKHPSWIAEFDLRINFVMVLIFSHHSPVVNYSALVQLRSLLRV